MQLQLFDVAELSSSAEQNETLDPVKPSTRAAVVTQLRTAVEDCTEDSTFPTTEFTGHLLNAE